MATNYYKPGKVMTFTAPSGGVTDGVLVFIGGMPVIPTTTAAAAASFEGVTYGVWLLNKASSQAWTEGQPIYWDATNLVGTTDSTAGLPIGCAGVAAASADTTGYVRLNGVSLSGRMFALRTSLAIATVNAGATLLAAIPGLKYRLHDAFAIAKGGAVTSVTTIDVKGTQSTSVVKLVAFGQAAMTQSAVVRAGASGGTVLADGASFAVCDAGSAITTAITGSAITVATDIIYALTYSIE